MSGRDRGAEPAGMRQPLSGLFSREPAMTPAVALGAPMRRQRLRATVPQPEHDLIKCYAVMLSATSVWREAPPK